MENVRVMNASTSYRLALGGQASARHAVRKTRAKMRALSAKTTSESVSASKQLPTVQEQRAAARDMVAYFKQKKYEEELLKNQKLGWVPKAEISNGRWVMFGLLVGMLTEYSTGVNFIDQIKLLLVNLSIVDFD
mmetsp:Transcript_8682/g.23590  ORF Transcript_8682/g.23590 Transcript_8682/m.23590 type:complete len:134 (+) Transcript_8682:57-458(+)|eukprot:CAMPEP_0197472898 /NCGR_PEP_ID=MMETSP1309-20131121/4198_1 /TAXON_ID=464262 /ORGANISM="Genus nov. species nov., Strain RCC998" /LENGTH=133 /DNA_ID=CAMNT_0043011747 /DNA_START=53 /DNA_END=454 /DNA_ORIENTATION=-